MPSSRLSKASQAQRAPRRRVPGRATRLRSRIQTSVDPASPSGSILPRVYSPVERGRECAFRRRCLLRVRCRSTNPPAVEMRQNEKTSRPNREKSSMAAPVGLRRSFTPGPSVGSSVTWERAGCQPRVGRPRPLVAEPMYAKIKFRNAAWV
jgi:hypothetical protein